MQDTLGAPWEAELISALISNWAIKITSSEYLPLGAGSYHWAMTDSAGLRWFATVDDLGDEENVQNDKFARLESAFTTALSLQKDAHLDFVMAPTATNAADPSNILRLSPKYAASVRPLIDGRAGTFGPHQPHDRTEILSMLVHLHKATAVVRDTAPKTDFTIPNRLGLENALATTDEQWVGGPMSEAARSAVASGADQVSRMLQKFDYLANEVRFGGAEWVITHGEPHPGNVIRGHNGLKLIDWDTVQLAPPERDLWMVDGDKEDLARFYTSQTNYEVSPSSLEYYRLWWRLKNIACYTQLLSGSHHLSGDTRRALHFLRKYLTHDDVLIGEVG